ncbi:MAG: alpha/beta hydrolase [Proteobacteria bacterium]|nr:alpha/beta hydrolase [Pseudomonadota bacterium]
MHIDIGEISFHYQLAGQGPGLVLIHGFSDNLGMWYEQIPEFSKRCQVLAYDFRGHGRTRSPEGRISMDMHADDLAALLEALGMERPVVAGYSMGGRIALEFALKHPRAVAGLVMANMGVAGRNYQMSGQQAELTGRHIKMVLRLCETGDVAAIAEELVSKSLSREFQVDRPDVSRRYRDLKMENDPKHYTAVMEAMLETMASPPDLSRVACPVLLIAGEYDPFMNPEILDEMERKMAAELKILPSGHASAIEAPEAFNRAVLDFVERVQNGP